MKGKLRDLAGALSTKLGMCHLALGVAIATSFAAAGMPSFRYHPRACANASLMARATRHHQSDKPRTFRNPNRRDAAIGSWLMVSATGVPPAAAKQQKVGAPQSLLLPNGMQFPTLSFGLQDYGNSIAEELTVTAIKVGFRNFFASIHVRNQRGFAAGVAASGIPRDKLFICGSVYSGRARTFENAYLTTLQGCEDNLRAMEIGGISYLDMIMLDAPAKNSEAIQGQWRAFEDMLASGGARSLAVSNFSPEQLDCIFASKTPVPPVMNQLRLFAGGFNSSMVHENTKRGLAIQAYSPLNGGHLPSQVQEACAQIGKKYKKTFAQIALRWLVEKGLAVTTQSFTAEHFAENIDIFDFEMTTDEINQLSSFVF